MSSNNLTSQTSNGKLNCKVCGGEVFVVCTFDGEYGVHEAKVFSFNSKIGALTRHNCNLPKPVADKFFGERSFALDEEQVDEALLESVKAAAEKEMREAN